MYPHNTPMAPHHHHHPVSSTHGLTPVIYSSMVNVRTSSEYNANHSANHILLNTHHDSTTEQSSAWCALKCDHNQYVMIGSGDLKTFMAITTQGRGIKDDQWVSSYKIKFSYDGISYIDYYGGNPLCGNNDKDTPVTHFFNPPIYARSIMVIPVTFHNHISMRMELYAKLA